jgi:butyryl-CoA dehydrogenase
MNFEFTQEQLADADRFRSIVNEKIAPLAQKIDQSPPTERDEILRSSFKTLGESGYLKLSGSEGVGGGGRGALEWTLHAEILAKACPSTFLAAYAATEMACVPITLFGNEIQRQQYVVQTLNGDMLGAFALTEPEGGSDPLGIKTTAGKDGDGWVLNGCKTYVTNGPVCDFAVVLAVTKSDGGVKGMSLFIIDAKTAGFDNSKRLETMGHRGAALGELVFKDCRVGPEALIGMENEGFGYAMHAMQSGRLAASVGSLGIGQAGLALALPRAMTRESRGKKIIRNQEVSFKLAEMYALIDTGRLLVQYAASSIDAGDAETGPNVSCAKIFTSEAATKISSLTVQIFGAAGYVVGHPAERLYRDARAGEIMHGPSEIQRVMLAQDLIGKYGV